MSDEQSGPEGIASRVRRLAELLTETELSRLSIEREDEHIEISRRSVEPTAAPVDVPEAGPPIRAVDTIRADLVGIFRVGRPAPFEGEYLEGDRELAYVEALGIRNPVRSLGPGRIVSLLCGDGDAVEYGQPLFTLDRGA